MGLWRKVWVLLVCAALLLLNAGGTDITGGADSDAQQEAVGTKPKLVVVLVVDQMRADYIERFRHQWKLGLKRLLDHGAWFRLAAYPYMNTVTCTGHATIATGAFPATHGIVLNAWFDREQGAQVSCTDDPGAQTISYGAQVKTGGHSAQRLLVPTLSDEMRAQLGKDVRVVTFSIKTRSAMMLAGHKADAVTWFDGSGAWVTSSAYSKDTRGFIEKFVKDHPVENDWGKDWDHLLSSREYLYEDDAPGERPPGNWTNTLPHALGSGRGFPDASFYGYWQTSPFADAYLGKMAAAAVDAMKLGKEKGTDYLGVSFSALDAVGHDFGPRSHEVQDVLARLDVVIGEFLAHLDKTVGPDNYVVALTSDHGVAPVPEQMTRLGFDAGRVVNQDVAARVDKALEGVWGAGKYVARMTYPDLYFLPGVFDKLRKDPPALEAVEKAILSTPGVWRVFRGDELWHARSVNDSVAQAASWSYYRGRSGDMIVMPKPYWFFVGGNTANVPTGGTTHGTSHLYDARVPVVFFGRWFTPGEYLAQSSPADIAPTLALLCGVTLARPDGRVLSEALAMPQTVRQVTGGKKNEE